VFFDRLFSKDAASRMSEILKSSGGLNQAADIVETMLAEKN
jgi:UDP:flavonoid glycosyltransferase YjiC (YdhE family)